MKKITIYSLLVISILLSACSSTSSRLDLITKNKVLRIGTTGDYPPFSLKVGNDYRGSDIERGKRLAESLGARPVFVETTWGSLLEDLGQDKFDIAMGGISIKLGRQKEGLFSREYLNNGKSAISLCKNRDRFNSLDKIDRKSTKLVVNPGGTNQKYVNANIKKAKVLIIEDNTKIFQSIINKSADVMITDVAEIEHQMAQHPRVLCQTLGRPLTKGALGYLMPRDIFFKEYVDLWLIREIGRE